MGIIENPWNQPIPRVLFFFGIIAKSGGISDPRNTVLMKMFTLIDIGERAGSGIPNIYSVWNKQGWSAPTISEEFDPERITLSLPLKKAAIKSGDKDPCT